MTDFPSITADKALFRGTVEFLQKAFSNGELVGALRFGCAIVPQKMNSQTWHLCVNCKIGLSLITTSKPIEAGKAYSTFPVLLWNSAFPHSVRNVETELLLVLANTTLLSLKTLHISR
jgi:hypothetical protein